MKPLCRVARRDDDGAGTKETIVIAREQYARNTSAVRGTCLLRATLGAAQRPRALGLTLWALALDSIHQVPIFASAFLFLSLNCSHYARTIETTRNSTEQVEARGDDDGWEERFVEGECCEEEERSFSFSSLRPVATWRSNDHPQVIILGDSG